MHLFTSLLLLFFITTYASSRQQPPRDTAVNAYGEIPRGKVLYEKFACHSCHGNKGEIEGNFSDLKKRYPESELKAYIKNPRLYNNKQMPVYEGIINDTDLNDIILYLHHLGEGLAN